MKSEVYKWVVVKHPGCNQPYMFYSPAGVDIRKGDTVYCETKKGIKEAKVITEFECSKNDCAFQAVADVCGLEECAFIRPIESVMKRMRVVYETKTPEKADGYEELFQIFDTSTGRFRGESNT